MPGPIPPLLINQRPNIPRQVTFFQLLQPLLELVHGGEGGGRTLRFAYGTYSEAEEDEASSFLSRDMDQAQEC